MAKRKVRLQIRKIRRLAARSNVKNKEYAKKLDKNREIIKKDNIQVEVTLSRSVIGKLPSKVRTVVALGLKRIGDMKKHTLNKAIRGMLNRTINMIDIKEVK